MKPKEWDIREVQGSDIPFIYSSWSQSMRFGSSLGKGTKDVFFREYTKIIDWILNQENTHIWVACLPQDPHLIFSYLVHQPGILHYVFTKQAFFRFGIAKSLLERAGKIECYTHKTFQVEPILQKYSHWVYNPFKLYKQGETNG